MHYIRARDGQTVGRDEACMPTGQVRAGYSVRVPAISDANRSIQAGEYISFDISLADSAHRSDMVSLRDAAVTLTDAESTLAVSKAQRAHYQRHAYLGDRAPAFTDAQATAAVSAAVATKQARTMTDSAIGIRDAETTALRYVHDQAKAARKQAITNGWRK